MYCPFFVIFPAHLLNKPFFRLWKIDAKASRLLSLSSQVVVGVLLEFLSVHSVLALASTCRTFRSLMREERVWKTLLALDLASMVRGEVWSALHNQLTTALSFLARPDLEYTLFARADKAINNAITLLDQRAAARKLCLFAPLMICLQEARKLQIIRCGSMQEKRFAR